MPSSVLPSSAINPDVLVLVSHSSKDVDIASALVEYLRAGLLISKIRCSSVDGFRLPAGVNTESQLRAEINSARVLIGLITPNSLASAYVMFELGARWGADKFMIPLLAGATPDMIREPLSLLNSLNAANESQLHQLIGDVGGALGIAVQNPATYVKQLSNVTNKCNAMSEATTPPAKDIDIPQLKKAEVVSPQEQRRRNFVSAAVKNLGENGRRILRHIDDQGQVNANALRMDSLFSEVGVDKFVASALQAGLILYENHVITIKPDLRAAVGFVLSNEYGHDL
jgi:hypothetical protein